MDSSYFPQPQKEDAAPPIVPRQYKPHSSGMSGMPLVHHVCRKKKRVYDTCVSKHYQNFVAGTPTSTSMVDGGEAPSLKQEDVCGDRFEAYRECILKGIKKEIWDKQGLPPPGEGSPLAEIADNE